MTFRSAVITFPGSNCDRDMADALEKISGVAPSRVWHGDAELPANPDFIALPWLAAAITACMIGLRAAIAPERR